MTAHHVSNFNIFLIYYIDHHMTLLFMHLSFAGKNSYKVLFLQTSLCKSILKITATFWSLLGTAHII